MNILIQLHINYNKIMIKPIGLIMKKFSYDDEYRPARTAAKAMGSGFSRKNDEECATKLGFVAQIKKLTSSPLPQILV